MRNRRLILTVLALIALAMPSAAMAQSNIMYGSTRNPLMNSSNPAFFPRNSKLYLALPGANLNFSSPLAVSSIFRDDNSDTTSININSLLDTLSSDRLRLTSSIHFAGLGLDFGKFFLTASVQAKIDFGFGVPQGIVTFLNEGNYNHTGDDIIELIDGNFINAKAYGEGALGLGVRLTKNLTVGARAKLLIGYLDLSNAGSSLSIRTEPDYSAMTANLDLNMNLTSAAEINIDTATNKVSIGNINAFPGNRGLNFDLGVSYTNDLFEVSASILDIGPGIHWTDGVKRVVSARERNSFTFSGVDVSSILQGGTLDSTYTQMLIDSLKSMADYKIIDGDGDYWTTIPTKVNLGGMFHISKGLSVGFHYHGEFERGLVKDDLGNFKNKNIGYYSSTSLLGRLNISDWIEIIVSASVLTSNGNYDWLNPGVGLTLTPLKTLQVYAFMDYISNIYVVDAKQISLSLGLNLLFGSSAK